MKIDEMAIKNIAGMIERKSFDFAYGWLQAMRVHSGLSLDVGRLLQADLEAAHKAHLYAARSMQADWAIHLKDDHDAN